MSSEVPAGGGIATNSVSFDIPLAKAPVVRFVRANGKEVIESIGESAPEEVTPTNCFGSAKAPTASPGFLCVYAHGENNVLPVNESNAFPRVVSFGTNKIISEGVESREGSSADSFGFGIVAISKEEGFVGASGSWAVTAE